MLPIERNARLIHLSATTPPQPMDQRKVSPADLEEAGRHYPDVDVDAGGRAAAVSGQVVGCGRSSLTRKPPLLCRSAEPRYEPDRVPCFLPEIFGRRLDALEGIERHAPTVSKVTNVGLGDFLAGWQEVTTLERADLAN